MVKKKTNEGIFLCPVGRLFSDFEKTIGKNSDFLNHLTKSQVEFLKAIRSLLDQRIEGIEKKKPGNKGKKASKIKVE